MAGQPWDASYYNGQAPWDIGRPQPAIVRLAAAGGFTGPVLDAGCGTGENALYVAGLGLPSLGPVLGIDVAESALAMGRAKAADRRLDVTFEAADALELGRLGRRFRTVMDCGLFHTFDLVERRAYVAGLAAVTEPDSTIYVLCFSDEGEDLGPHPIDRATLYAAFRPSEGWRVAAIVPERIETRVHAHGVPAWLLTTHRT